MNTSWDNFFRPALIGFMVGLLIRGFAALRTRLRLYQTAGKIAGTWSAHNMRKDDGNFIDPDEMKNAPHTTITRKKRWQALRADSHILDVSAPEARNQKGWVVIDRILPDIATRIVLYEGSDEASYQDIILGLPDEEKKVNTLHVFPRNRDDYKRHALCRTTKPRQPIA